ncbi:hypothetical protein AXF42_Ash019360 [Apostasia shenzhenica]|uniref:Protein NUCLEAR FUSION DEFECTIVE 6, chloroplastic/mitochondrial n=1 Tax=Apostasia shenzhenica TaxID=1088818 RepID=A0A2H9ZTK3_9ASPA|nr:hypothetical protein AXF42_Ash019360 [Apostasia shenzhenica]
MATVTARSVFRSASLRNAAESFASKACGRACSPFMLPKLKPRFLRPRSMACFCLESLLPMHSSTASALMTSLLSVSLQRHGYLAGGCGKDDV